MKEDIKAEVLFNRQVNYLIIEKMWEYLNEDKEKQELYSLLKLNKNAYSRIRKADIYDTVDLDKRWETKNSALRKIGLSKEIMTGKEMIQVDGITEKDWKEYIKLRYPSEESNDSTGKSSPTGKSSRASDLRSMNKKLKEIFVGLEAGKKDKRDIDKLFYFFKYGRALTPDMHDEEMLDLRDSLQHVSLDKMKMCDKALRKEVFEMLQKKYEQLYIIVKYDSLSE